MIWFILYVVIGIVVGWWMREDVTDSGLILLGAMWPLLILLLVFMWFLDLIGFRIH